MTPEIRRRDPAPGAAPGLLAVALLLLWSPPAPAPGTEVRFHRMHTREEFLAGTLEGVGIDTLGTLQLADRVERLADIEEPFLFVAAEHPRGWVVGTGNGGRVLLVERDGTISTLFAAPEPEIFALWVDPDGTVYAGSSPEGKVYRIGAGEAEELFDPGETYIWALGRAEDGGLLVATGTEGRLYRVNADGDGEVLYDSDDIHLRALATLPGGEVLLGTAGDGLIVVLEADGSARTLYDAAQPEVVAFALDPGGDYYAAVLDSEASWADPGRKPQPQPQEGEEARGREAEAGGDQPQVQVIVEGEFDSAARAPALRGARSEILRITPDGLVETLWTFEQETVYSLAWLRERLWVGTGLDGKLYSHREGKMVLEKDVDERQVVTLLADSPGPAFATTNAAALYRISGEPERRGTYTSPALDAGQVARFGVLQWRGQLPAGARFQFSFRSGMSAQPDRTWSEWTEPRPGREVSLTEVPMGRYVQWRAHFQAGEGRRSPHLSEVTLSYRQRNVAPRIVSLTVLDPGEILVPPNFNPSNQVYEPVHPNREGIFTDLRPPREADPRRLKQLWKRGYRTLRWEAEDANDDGLRFALSFRPDQGEEWLPVIRELEDSWYSFDATVLPDGVYRFRLEASDAPGNGSHEALHAEEVSPPVVVDHGTPALSAVRLREGELEVVVSDELSPLRLAEVSLDAAGWHPAVPEDGLLDGRSETLVLELDQEREPDLLLLRLMDAAFNVRTYDLTEHLP